MHTLNLRLSPDEIGWIAGHANDRFLIIDDVLLPLYEQIKGHHPFEKVIVFRFGGAAVPDGMIDYDRFLAEAPADFTYPEHAETDPSSMCYTSGTTGKPKGVVYSHRSTVLHSMGAVAPDAMGLKNDDVVLPVTPMFHANAWGVPYAAMMVGAKFVFPGPHLHADDLLDLFQVEPPTLSLGVPTIWLTLIQAMESKPGKWTLPAGMRSLIGGSAAPESLIRAFTKHGVTLRQAWGMTEDLAAGFRRLPQGRTGRRLRRRGVQADGQLRRAGRGRRDPPDRRGRQHLPLGRQLGGGDPDPRTLDHRRLSRRAARSREVLRRWLAAHRRRGSDRPDGLHAHLRPHQGPDQVGRRVDQLGRSGERHHGASGPSPKPR